MGVAFPEGPELFPFYENLAKRQLLPFYAHFVGHFYRFTQTHQFFIGVLRVREKGRGGEKIAEIAERDVKEVVLLNAAEKIVSQGQPRVALTTPSRASTWLMRSDCFPVALSMTL